MKKRGFDDVQQYLNDLLGTSFFSSFTSSGAGREAPTFVRVSTALPIGERRSQDRCRARRSASVSRREACPGLWLITKRTFKRGQAAEREREEGWAGVEERARFEVHDSIEEPDTAERRRCRGCASARSGLPEIITWPHSLGAILPGATRIKCKASGNR